MAKFKGDDGPNLLEGTNKDDEIFGFGGEDTLDGEGGDDLIKGGAGDDHIHGGKGDDTIDGGPGNDDIHFVDTTVGVKADLQKGTASGEGKDTLAGIENIEGSKFDDIFLGSREANFLDGFDGDDLLDGRKGDDTLFGGFGKDTLEGGRGNDTFDYNDKGETGVGNKLRDTIVDFTPGQDKIDLFDIDANEVGGTSNDAFLFIGNGPIAFTAAGQLRFNNGVVQGETDGDGIVDFEIEVIGVPFMAPTDFIP